MARRLSRPRPAQTPLLVAVTGYGDLQHRLWSAESGIDLHLVKPIMYEDLERVLVRFRHLLNGLVPAAAG